MSDVSQRLRDEVVLRAGNRCEYCGLSQIGHSCLAFGRKKPCEGDIRRRERRFALDDREPN